MRVGRAIPVFYPETTGPAYQAQEISKRLIKRGHETPVYATTRGAEKKPQIETVDGIPVRRFQTFFGRLPYDLVPGVIPTLARDDFDVLHAHGYRNFLTDVSFAVSRLRHIPFVLQTHGTLIGYRRTAVDSPTWQYRVYDAVTRRVAARRADHVIVSTTQEREEAVEFGVSQERISVIPVGKNVEHYQSAPLSPPEDVFRLLFVGRLAPGRNVEQVVEAMAELPSDIELRVIGGEVSLNVGSSDGYVDKLITLTEHLGVSDRVSFVGPKYEDELVKEYRSAHAFVYTSRYENFGQTILEAAASGLPIVATPVGVANDLVEEGVTGYLVPFDDPEATATSIESLRSSDHRAMGRRLELVVTQEYSWPSIIDEYERIYSDLTAKQ